MPGTTSLVCPACDNTLSPMPFEGIEVDVCSGGCGGVWFDAHELARARRLDDQVTQRLQTVPLDPSVVPGREQRRSCPRCQPVVGLRASWFGPKRAVEVDRCGACGGIWLDVGELARIERLYSGEAEPSAPDRPSFYERHMSTEGIKERARDDKRRLPRTLRALGIYWWG